ncbi:MAG: S-layer protein [Subdoligranulum sp.]|nr:S-layer protein [Subdoligranulum sp.]
MRKNILKRAAAVVLTGAMLLVSLAGCGGTPSSASASTAGSSSATSATDSGAPAPTKQFVIGVAEAQANDEVTTRRAYFENFIAPTYNVKFIFSEVLKDDAAVKTFIENCIDSGVDAIIDFKSNSAQMARLCEENDVVYTVQGIPDMAPELMEGDFPLFTGWSGADNAQVGNLFRDWLEANASEDGSEGFLVSTSLAAQGNVQHVEVSRAILEGLQEKYELTYEKTIDELVASSETTNVANDKNILITLYPGSPNKETWLPGISSLLQSGKYAMFLSSGQTYNQSATAVNEVEQAFGIDIKVASIAAFSTTLTTAFNTQDPNGNPSVDMVTVKPSSALNACLFATTYNALNGAIDTACRDADGNAANYRFQMISITSPEELAMTEGWDDRDTGTWIAGKEFVDSMLVTNNPDITPEDINKIMASLNVESISAMMEKA